MECKNASHIPVVIIFYCNTLWKKIIILFCLLWFDIQNINVLVHSKYAQQNRIHNQAAVFNL